MQVAKWGNSLAVRLPAEVVRTLGLKEGDDIQLCALDTGAVAVLTEKQRRAAALSRLDALAVAAPPGFAFNRDEANAR